MLPEIRILGLVRELLLVYLAAIAMPLNVKNMRLALVLASNKGRRIYEPLYVEKLHGLTNKGTW